VVPSGRTISDLGGDAPLVIYNVDDIEGGAQLYDDLQRFPVGIPTYVISGRQLGDRFKSAIQAAPPKPGRGNYWISGAEMEQRGLHAKPGAVPISMSNGNDSSKPVDPSAMNVVLFSVDQLTDPTEGYMKAGTITR